MLAPADGIENVAGAYAAGTGKLVQRRNAQPRHGQQVQDPPMGQPEIRRPVHCQMKQAAHYAANGAGEKRHQQIQSKIQALAECLIRVGFDLLHPEYASFVNLFWNDPIIQCLSGKVNRF